ncbi:RICIN domain-containing protein [Streptomyces olivochromogenes]|uniref:RICIN domain-containing protein n=1 Tax=Streptomyces olivochromogenes TaxID=1963 RepID=UPI001F31591E|nr:RICIN domain-containing protein [Streptomyces olivochromogenes]MCF3132142.1 hypothetical protein [Streptomyces olivochromogenes]
MKHLKTSGLAVAVSALAFSLVGPVSPAQAQGPAPVRSQVRTGYFSIVNKDTGKCLEWNGYNKKITQEKCRSTPYQWWNYDAAKLCNYVSIGGDYCLGEDGRDKPVYGRHNRDAPQLFYSSLRNNAVTTIGALHCGYFKVVSGKVMCGARILINHGHSYSPKMKWVIKY